jgi:undecaprenyl-diphosphatase
MKWQMLGCLVILGMAAATAVAETPAPEARATAAAETPAPAARATAEPTHITVVQAAILGAIQGLTEYLPVSSTGHLILANYAMGLSAFSDRIGPLGRVIEENEAVDAFDIILHLGTFLAVLGLYRGRVLQMLRGLAGRDPAGLRLLIALAIAFVPAAIFGFLGHHWITENLYNPLTVAMALAVGGAAMIVIEHYFGRSRNLAGRVTQVDATLWRQALVIGLAQCLALWPGTSRSMVTILAGLVVGLDLLAAAEFSFLLALPTIGAATAMTALKHGHSIVQAAGVDGMLVGLVVTTVVAAVVIKAFLKWLSGHGLTPFGIYRIALAGAVLMYFAWCGQKMW